METATLFRENQRSKLRIVLSFPSPAIKSFGADAKAALGRGLAAAGCTLVHACDGQGRGIDVVRAFFAAGGELCLVVPDHLKDSEPLTWLAQELVLVDGEDAAAEGALARADAVVVISETGVEAHSLRRLPRHGDGAADGGAPWASARAPADVQSALALIRDFKALLGRRHPSRPRAPADLSIAQPESGERSCHFSAI